MIVDQFLRVSTAQAVTTSAVSTDTVDLSVARDIGAGNDIYMYFTIPTAFAGGTSIQFQGRRYLGANYVVVGTMTAGNVTADIADDISDNKTYASGFSVT